MNLQVNLFVLDIKSFKEEIIDFVKDLIIIIIIVLTIRTFLIEPFQISGQSMYATYYDREFIIVDRFSYLDIPKIKEWEIKRWDVVVFKPGVSAEKEYFIKRVIALWGDSVKVEDGNVYLKKAWEEDFSILDESDYLTDDNNWATFVKWGIKLFSVPEGKYYVMWDNRNHSSDSRSCFGYSCLSSSRDSYLDKENITWKVLLDLWYFNFRTFSYVHPSVQEEVEIDWELKSVWIPTNPKWFSSLSTYDYN